MSLFGFFDLFSSNSFYEKGGEDTTTYGKEYSGLKPQREEYHDYLQDVQDDYHEEDSRNDLY